LNNVLQSEIAHPTAQAPQIFRYNIFCNDAAVRADDRGQPHNVIAAARIDVLMLVDLSGKRLELLKEAVPNLSRVALLVDPTSTAK
jgi:hypothetical protein